MNPPSRGIPMPPEWPPLVAGCDQILGPAGNAPISKPLSSEQAVALYDFANRFDNLTLDKNRYYGLGKAMCRMAILLQNPERRTKAVEDASNKAASYLRIIGSRQVRIRDIGHLSFSGLFDALSQEAVVQGLSPGEIAATDALTECAVSRRNHREGERPASVQISQISQRRRTISAINLDMDSSASVLIRRALSAQVSATSSEVFIKDVISEEGLRDMRLTKAGVFLARLRADEFLSWGKDENQQAARVLPNGEIQTNKTFLDQDPPQELGVDSHGSLQAIRQERLSCPALRAGLIPLVLDLLPDILIRTDQKLAGQYF